MIGPLFAAIALAALQPAPAPAAERIPRRVLFARAALEGWRLEAITDVDRVGGQPMIYSSYCEMKRSGLKLTTWAEAGLRIDFGDSSVEPELGFEGRQIRRIAIDDVVWEYRDIDTRAGERQFLNIAYRQYPPCRYSNCVRSFRREMRRRAGDPWLPPELLNNALLRGRTLRIGFLQMDADDRLVPPILWAAVPLAGLDRAIAWCQAALASDGARRLRGGLEEE